MSFRFPILVVFLSLFSTSHADASDWWNKEWTQRQELTLDTTVDGANLSDVLSGVPVLIRLHDGNFQFASASADGSDIRIVSSDGKTLLPHHIERYDSLINEAFVWVKLAELPASAKITFHLYYGAANPAVVPASPPSDTYEDSTALVYHFADASSNDSTTHVNHPASSVTAAEGSLIGGGLRLLGAAPLVIPASSSLEWKQGQDFTWSAWLRPSAFQDNAVIFHRGEGAETLRLLLNQGIPLIETSGTRSAGTEAIPAGNWTHLALVSSGGNLSLFVNGEPHSSLAATLPANNTDLFIGGLPEGTPANGSHSFVGEIDELHLSSTARSQDWLKFAAINQGTSDVASRTLFLGELHDGGTASGGHSEMLEHVLLFGDIAKNMMFDGWIAVGVCVIMILVGWTVAARKFLYLNSIQKGTEEFLQLWKRLSSDLTAIDHSDAGSVRSFGGNANPETIALVEKSPLYQIYHIGSEEIKHRLERDKHRTKGLSGRSIQAIRAALDTGLVRATHKLTNGLVYLTISIAGGPYVGLLGTVVGVMITFAIIAKSGEVDVNSIAPGIASALLATVAGLIVAIPALFIYSYLNNRIKNITSEIHVFIDEFVAKMAEFYPPEGESSPYASGCEHQLSNAQH